MRRSSDSVSLPGNCTRSVHVVHENSSDFLGWGVAIGTSSVLEGEHVGLQSPQAGVDFMGVWVFSVNEAPNVWSSEFAATKVIVKDAADYDYADGFLWSDVHGSEEAAKSGSQNTKGILDVSSGP